MTEKREQWPSRLSFILAAMGSAVGVGNLLRYPSIAARHYGLQWFIPYFAALIIVGIPMLALEIALGQSMRGGSVVAFGAINRRLRGLGFTATYLSYSGVIFYVTIMSWVMTFFRYSFKNPLPWLKIPDFFRKHVVRDIPGVAVAGEYFLQYRGLSLIGETLLWTVVTWILIYFSVFKGVAVTGKVVYITMFLPLLLCTAILIRAVTLPGAYQGIMLYVGSFSISKLSTVAIWKDAIIQIFFSVGVGFGTFIAYSSYNTEHANAVQDAFIVSCSNSAFEVLMGFATFSIIGVLGIDIDKERVSSFAMGFETYPQALGKLPGANIWAAIFFLTIYLLAIDSAFGSVENVSAVVTDSDWGKKLAKPIMTGIICFISLLLSTMYATEFGYALLDAVDWWLNGITLMFAAWAQLVSVTSMYRYKEVISQTGVRAFALAQGSFIMSMMMGTIFAFTVSNLVGVLIFVLILCAGTAGAAMLSDAPEIIGAFGEGKFMNSLWWLTSYSGEMLKNDLNAVIAQGKNWSLPSMWAPMMRWITAPVLMYMLGYGYDEYIDGDKFHKDPLHVFSFILSHVGILFTVMGFMWPGTFSWLSPSSELEADQRQYVPGPGKTLYRDTTACSGKISVYDETEAEIPSSVHP